MKEDGGLIDEFDFNKEFLRSAKDTVALLKELSSQIKNPFINKDIDDNRYIKNDFLESTIYGSSENIVNVNSALREVMFSRPKPFVIRAGHEFLLPGETDSQAVDANEVWDWTYVFGKSEISNKTRLYLKDLYVKKNEWDPAVSTSWIGFTDSNFPEDLGLGLIIFGMIIFPPHSGYCSLMQLGSTSLVVPTHAVFRHKDSTLAAISDPISARLWYQTLINNLQKLHDNSAFSDHILFPHESEKPSYRNDPLRFLL